MGGSLGRSEAHRRKGYLLVQINGAVNHPAYQVITSVRPNVPWPSSSEQVTKYFVTPPLLLHHTITLKIVPASGHSREAVKLILSRNVSTSGLARKRFRQSFPSGVRGISYPPHMFTNANPTPSAVSVLYSQS